MGTGIAVDSSGNTYITGRFSGTVDFDPGAATANLTSAGGEDTFITKLDPNGNYVWAKRIGGSGGDVSRNITIDSSGNSYTTGWFSDTVDFNPGAGVANLTSAAGTDDIFILKLDTNGNYVWAKNLGGNSTDFGNSIAVDSSGNTYTTGYFSGTADFNPNAGVFNLTSTGGSNDIFIVKLNASGNYLWAKRLGNTGGDEGRSIAVDSSGNTYTTGFFAGTVDFDPGAGTANRASAGGNDIFITKLDTSGNYVWANRLGDTGNDSGTAITVDSSGNTYVTGTFTGTIVAGANTLTSAGGNDIFITKLDTNGNYVWAKNIGASSGSFGSGITVDSSGNTYITGSFSGTADFDPGAGVANLTSAGVEDIFMLKLDTNGNYQWAKNVGGSSSDFSRGIAIDSTGNAYTAGYFQGTVNFDPSSGVASVTSAGSDDILIFKLNGTPIINTITSTQVDGNYGIGTVIPIAVTFSEPVTVTGTPTLTLNTGANVTYASGSGPPLSHLTTPLPQATTPPTSTIAAPLPWLSTAVRSEIAATTTPFSPSPPPEIPTH
ncbi:SBBP repeat-containing protein [[Phormidium] sp. ETS-05]|uniref:SBBP repeat-containing protein n=1 Tax=[Phormidium] sp. ETS-05 TaxID=222819 RepID=UPI0035C922B2